MDGVEDLERYRAGGYHPVSIGDEFDGGRYRILQKLGWGGSSTVWLARDQEHGKGTLVTLKALRSDASPAAPDDAPELFISNKLRAAFPTSLAFQTVDRHFLVHGPNGTHLFLILPLAGPNVRTMSECPWQPTGSQRLRADVARDVAKQTATALSQMHRAGIVHGDLTTSNILFRLAPHASRWSDAELYFHLGEPFTEDVETLDGSPPIPHAPAAVVAPLDGAVPFPIEPQVVLGDFGQSYVGAAPPADYDPATVVHYVAPEVRFDGRTGAPADVWALGCTMFEIRAGAALFATFMGHEDVVLGRTVGTLGPLPEEWAEREQARALREDPTLTAEEKPLRERLREIGEQEEPVEGEGDPMFEQVGTRLSEQEVELLGDLLEKTLKYRPEERISAQDVLLHPWFSL